MAYNYYKTCATAREVKLKNYFYLLRTALASLWIVEEKSIPPLRFQELLPLVQDNCMQQKIAELLQLKAEANETYLHPKESELEAYCLNILTYCVGKTDDFAKQPKDADILNKLFRSII